jgi:3-dehydroquinate dehydratase-2|tara:strand:+ start:14797 stop:15225 length:429 start_codon:yes stop_codon:yes gene_type:complete
VLFLNGPNLNLLGQREPEVYGQLSLSDLNDLMADKASRLGLVLTTYQSNIEGELVNRVHQAKLDGVDFIVINPGAYTHTSVAIRDAFLGTEIPFIEVHLSNIFSRESFRHQSYLSDIAVGVISGFGAHGYELALQAAVEQLS